MNGAPNMSIREDDRAACMKISVITVCLNAARTIADTIQAIRSQNHPNIEYIVVDGGSTDETLAIIAENRDVISVLVTGPDKGMYDAANKGIKLASGTIVGMLNADDFYADENVLSDVARAFAKGSDAVYGDLHYVDRERPEMIRRNWVSGLYDRKNFLSGWMPPHPTFFISRSAYETFGMFRSDFKSAADYELMLRMLYKHSLKPAYIDRVLVKMRVGGKSNVSIANRIRANREDRNAWNVNGLRPAWYTLYLKPLSKVGQYSAGLDRLGSYKGRAVARAGDRETTETEPFTAVQSSRSD
jgi:glycosyltransferase involved in cell wall biosynthesis